MRNGCLNVMKLNHVHSIHMNMPCSQSFVIHINFMTIGDVLSTSYYSHTLSDPLPTVVIFFPYHTPRAHKNNNVRSRIHTFNSFSGSKDRRSILRSASLRMLDLLTTMSNEGHLFVTFVWRSVTTSAIVL